MTGMLAGSLLVGRISDNFGRKVAFFVSLGFQVGTSSRSSTDHFIFLPDEPPQPASSLHTMTSFFLAGSQYIDSCLTLGHFFLSPRWPFWRVPAVYSPGDGEKGDLIVNGAEENPMT